MKIKKLLIILILVLMIFPIKTNAQSECFEKCSGSTTKCRECCEKFVADKDLGTNTFNATNFKDKYNSNCKKYLNGAKLAVQKTKDSAGCRAILGNVENEESVAWMVQQIFNIVKYAGPFLVLVLSSVDFAKTIVQNDEETMKKAQKKLIIRLIAMVFLFFVPDLVFTILNIFGMVSTDPTCGIS